MDDISGEQVHAMCNVQALVTNGILKMAEDADEESLAIECVFSFIKICNSNYNYIGLSFVNLLIYSAGAGESFACFRSCWG